MSKEQRLKRRLYARPVTQEDLDNAEEAVNYYKCPRCETEKDWNERDLISREDLGQASYEYGGKAWEDTIRCRKCGKVFFYQDQNV